MTDPIYDVKKSYLENFEKGPFFKGVKPKRDVPPQEEWVDFLGHSIATPLGVPAGPLLNARWVTFAAEMGFDILTYKTIRSRSHPAHPVPNMIYLDTGGSMHDQEVVYPAPGPTGRLALTNSFGMPSMEFDYLAEDIARANASLAPGQVMLVSIVGSPRDELSLFEDYALTARMAVDAGAKIVEANLSCPNVTTGEGSLYSDPEAVFEVTTHIKRAIGAIPLILKLGAIREKACLRAIMLAAARGGAEAVCGINTVSAKVLNRDGSPALGPKRVKAGVCGDPIRECALEFLSHAHAINTEENLALTLLGTGGVTRPEHFDAFFDAGADVAMSAVGMMWDPYLATKYHQKGNKLWMRKLETVS